MPQDNETNVRQCGCGCGVNITADNSIYVAGCGDVSDDCAGSCEGCDRNRLNEDLTIIDGSAYCGSCYFTCADCGENSTDTDTHYENCGGDRICEGCRDNYYTCEDCGCVISSDETYTEYGTYCRPCWRSRRDDGPIFDYSHKRELEYFGGHAHRYYGLEIEVERTRSRTDCETAATNVNNDLWICKHDGSIDDGFECVSQPGSYAYWQAYDFAPMKYLGEKGYRSFQTDTCGLHIHVCRKSFTPGTIYKLVRFFANHAGFILKISGREKRKLEQYAAVSDIRTAYQIGAGVKRHGNRYSQDNRYSAINLQNKHTVEFRFFRGNLQVEVIKRNIAFLHTLIGFCEYHLVAQCNLWHYREWVKTCPLVDDTMRQTLSAWVNRAINSTADESAELETV